MHAVVVKVSVRDPQAAEALLRDQVVPRVSGAPGFVAGYWVRLGEDKGNSIIVFESEDAARAVAAQITSPAEDAVTIDSVDVGAIVANA